MNAARIALLYAVIAVAATAANLATQFAVGHLFSGPHVTSLCIAAGTLAGLPVKYALEKRYIFGFRAESLIHDGETFFIYSVLGVAPTLIFWSTEYGFDLFFGGEAMRYAGALLGLSLGYAMKYQLDKRYVFCARAAIAGGRP